jgi:hypothetical protein
VRAIGVQERRARLAVRHRLAPSARVDDDLVGIARSVVALHATDPATVVLSAMARMATPDPAAIEHALYDEVLLLRMMAMRRTIFTCAVEDAALLQRSSGDAVAANERKRLLTVLEQAGIDDPIAWLADVQAKTLAALDEAGEAAAADLTKLVPELATKVTVAPGTKHAATVGLSSRVLNLMGMEGLLVRGRPKGRWTSSQHRWASLEARLGAPLAALPVEEARAELVRRWLDRFGPGTMADLKWWTGWTMGATRAAVAALDTDEVEVDGAPALLLADDVEPTPEPEPWVALLPGLDPTPMGWKERAWYLGDHRSQVFDSTGNVGPTIWVDGRIAGGWAHLKTGRIAFHLLEDVGSERAEMVAAAATVLEDQLGPDRVLPRFPSPLDRHLSA